MGNVTSDGELLLTGAAPTTISYQLFCTWLLYRSGQP